MTHLTIAPIGPSLIISSDYPQTLMKLRTSAITLSCIDLPALFSMAPKLNTDQYKA